MDLSKIFKVAMAVIVIWVAILFFQDNNAMDQVAGFLNAPVRSSGYTPPVQPVRSANAGSAADVDKLTTYAVMLGRATGCGKNMSSYAARVAAWVDRTWVPGSKEHSMYTLILAKGMEMNAEAASNGQSPEPCSKTLSAVETFPWP